MSASMTLWPITVGKVEMMMETESIPSSKSHAFLITNCLIPRENQREDYFYLLILLFVPFRDESTLLLKNEIAEAFHWLMNENSSAYHAKLQRILDAQSMIKEINEARQADGEEKWVNKDNDLKLMGEAKTAMHDMANVIVNHSSDQLSLEERVTMLN